MANKYRLPVFSEQALSEIIYGMENQDCDYVLNARDGSVYRSDMLAEFFSNPESETFIPLPDWTSADGYQLMVSFAQKCSDQELKKDLNRQLSLKEKGIFRRFKATLEQHDALQSWYDFKDRKMKAHIISWYSSRQSLFVTADETESSEEGLESSSLLVDFDVKISPITQETKSYISRILPTDRVIRVVYESSDCDKAACLIGNGVCGVIPFRISEGLAFIPYYYIEEKMRGLGLFHLLFDQLCRYLKREKVTDVVMFSNEGENSMRMLNDNDVKQTSVAGIIRFRLDEWTSMTESSDMAYLV